AVAELEVALVVELAARAALERGERGALVGAADARLELGQRERQAGEAAVLQDRRDRRDVELAAVLAGVRLQRAHHDRADGGRGVDDQQEEAVVRAVVGRDRRRGVARDGGAREQGGLGRAAADLRARRALRVVALDLCHSAGRELLRVEHEVLVEVDRRGRRGPRRLARDDRRAGRDRQLAHAAGLGRRPGTIVLQGDRDRLLALDRGRDRGDAERADDSARADERTLAHVFPPGRGEEVLVDWLINTSQTPKVTVPDAIVSARMRAPVDNIAAPPFPADLPWVNVAPLRMDKQLGRPVLVEFWDFCRPNSLRTLPYVRAWHDRYAAAGLRVISVHTPGFAPSRGEDAVRAAVARLGIEHPVCIDADGLVWSLYDNEGWPSRYLFNQASRLHDFHFGEGGYEETELAIQELLGIEREAPAPMRAEDDRAAR